ncbi:hypothetical protein GCM10027299_36560 [Larkinella ripae]
MKKVFIFFLVSLPGLLAPVFSFDLPGDKLPAAPVIQPIIGQEGKWLSVLLPEFTGGGLVYMDYTLRRFSGTPHNDQGASMPEGLSFNANLRNLVGMPRKAGRYTFMYAAGKSGHIGMATITLIIKPNLMPVAPSVGFQEVRAGQNFSIQLPEFSDPESAPLTLSANFLSSHTSNPSWLSFNPATRKITGTAPVNSGPAQNLLVMYMAKDEVGNQGIVQFKIIIKPESGQLPAYNQPAIGPKINPVYTKQGKFAEIELPRFTDRENNNLTYTLTYDGNGSTQTGMPGGLSFDPNTRKITGAPLMAGAYKMYYKAQQAEADPTSISFSLVVEANALPVAPKVQSQVVELGKPFSFILPAFTDPENDPITYQFGFGIGYNGTYESLPNWLHFDPTTRKLYGIAMDERSLLLSLRALDNINMGTVNFKFTVRKNTAPVAPAVKNYVYQVNKPMKVNLPVFTDPERDPITLTLVGLDFGLPNGLVFKPGDRELSGTPTKVGEYTLHYIGKDDKGLISSVSFKLQIVPYAPASNTTARLAAESAEVPREWNATILGNPVVGEEVELEVSEAQGQSLNFQLTDASGKPLAEQSQDFQLSSERVRLKIGKQLSGLYLLKIAGGSQMKALKVIK